MITVDGKSFTGTLAGIVPDTLSLCLAEAKDETGQVLHRVVLNGNIVAQIFAIEKPFDLKALAERLDKVFPTMVKLYEDKGFIWVMDKVKVTVMFRGREMVHRQMGYRQLDRVKDLLGELAVQENPPRMEGRFLSMILVSNKEAVAKARKEEEARRKEEEAEEATAQKAEAGETDA